MLNKQNLQQWIRAKKIEYRGVKAKGF